MSPALQKVMYSMWGRTFLLPRNNRRLNYRAWILSPEADKLILFLAGWILQAEMALQLLGSAAAVQVVVKKLLFAKDREKTIKEVQTFLDTNIAPQGLFSEWNVRVSTFPPFTYLKEG